jgi:hypothetical protein
MPINLKPLVESKIGPATVFLADGSYYADQPINVPKKVSVVGQSESGVVVEAMQPNLNVFNVLSSIYDRTNVSIRNLTIQSVQPNVAGIYSLNAGSNFYENLIFKGVARTIQINRGLGHLIRAIRVEQFGPNGCGQLLFESTDPNDHCAHIDIDGYQTYYDAFSTCIVFSRATNVTARGLSFYAPHQAGILVKDDSQGVQLANVTMDGVTDGICFLTSGGHSPLVNSMTDVNVDQATGTGYKLLGCPNLNVLGGMITDGWQGIEIGSYPNVERVHILGTQLSNHRANGIVVDPNGKYFKVIGTTVSGTSGAAMVVSGGASDHFHVVDNDFSQNNGSGFVDFSTGYLENCERQYLRALLSR